MKHTIITAICAAFVAAVVVFTGLTLVGNQSVGETVQQFGAALGITRYPNSGVVARYLKVSTTAGTASAGTDGTFSVGGGSELSVIDKCATATFNPGSLATSTITNTTSTDITLTGAVLGDKCGWASLTSATSSAVHVQCDITGTATATLSVVNLGTTNAAIDLATGTAKVCYTH